MRELLQTLYNNKEWIFSGVGVAIFSTIIGIIFKKKRDKINETTIEIGEKNSINDIIINQNPVDKNNSLYNDLLHKPITQIGDTIEATMKFVSLPFKFLGMTSDELENRYRIFISESVNKIPKNKIVQPSPLIAAKIFDNVKYSFNENDNNLTKMFSELLSSSMNQDTQKFIHPSYVDNLSNMNYVDGYICKYLYQNGYMQQTYFTIPYNKEPIIYNGKIHNKTISAYTTMNPTRKISYDSYQNKLGINISNEQLELSLSFLKSIDVISIRKESFSTTEMYIQHIKTMLVRYHEYDFSHQSGYFNYIFNNYQKKEVDYQYDLSNAISFIPYELSKENDEKFCELEKQIKFNYERITVKRTYIELTEYGHRFLKHCI